jgi:hypothetical protein
MTIAILTGLLFAGVGGYLVYQKHRLAKVGQRVPGTVIDIREHVIVGAQGGESRSWYAVLAFRTLDGREIRTEVRCGRRRGAEQAGSQIGVIYDPLRPSNAEIDTAAGRSAAYGYVAVATGLLIIVLGIAVVR